MTELETRIRAALDRCEGCCLDDPDDYEIVVEELYYEIYDVVRRDRDPQLDSVPADEEEG